MVILLSTCNAGKNTNCSHTQPPSRECHRRGNDIDAGSTEECLLAIDGFDIRTAVADTTVLVEQLVAQRLEVTENFASDKTLSTYRPETNCENAG